MGVEIDVGVEIAVALEVGLLLQNIAHTPPLRLQCHRKPASKLLGERKWANPAAYRPDRSSGNAQAASVRPGCTLSP